MHLERSARLLPARGVQTALKLTRLPRALLSPPRAEHGGVHDRVPERVLRREEGECAGWARLCCCIQDGVGECSARAPARAASVSSIQCVPCMLTLRVPAFALPQNKGLSHEENHLQFLASMKRAKEAYYAATGGGAAAGGPGAGMPMSMSSPIDTGSL